MSGYGPRQSYLLLAGDRQFIKIIGLHTIQSQETQDGSGFHFCKIAIIGPAKGADHHIFKDSHSSGDLHDLKSSSNPFPVRHKGFESCDLLSFEDHLPGIGLMITNDTVKKSRLARAIGTDDADDLAGRNRSAEIFQSGG